MIQRYCKGTFTKDYKKTIGVDFLERQITTNGEEVRLMLWDTAGQEEFDAITKAYYRGAQACVVAFSTTDRDSFTALKKWKKKVEDECGSIPMVLVQNKIDLIDQATVKPEEVESFARDCRMRLYRTSVKEDLNVDQVFNYLVERYLALISQPEDIYASKDVTETIFGNPAKLKKGDTITLNGKKKSSKKQLIKNACKVI
ncbi:ras-related protein Rab-23 [Macrobrachium rosenbergii]|uniref:ras-related protein Rab-23 n=1 Tax=Macrobrachium rosenbergii TaxID=79674 RepID=UPI0034D605B8